MKIKSNEFLEKTFFLGLQKQKLKLRKRKNKLIQQKTFISKKSLNNPI